MFLDSLAVCAVGKCLDESSSPLVVLIVRVLVAKLGWNFWIALFIALLSIRFSVSSVETTVFKPFCRSDICFYISYMLFTGPVYLYIWILRLWGWVVGLRTGVGIAMGSICFGDSNANCLVGERMGDLSVVWRRKLFMSSISFYRCSCCFLSFSYRSYSSFCSRMYFL